MKNIKSKILYTLVLTVFFAAGCDGLLDINPKQSIDAEVALNTSDNVEAVLIGAYNALSDDDLFGGEILFEPDLLADNNLNNEVQWTGTFEEPEQIWRKDIQVENGQVSATWSAAYNAINLTNNVLSALDVVDEDIRDRVEGEALFIRGIIYFNLLKLYGLPYSAGNVGTNLGVPLVTTPTDEINEESEIPRETVQAGYQRVLTDLQNAESLLPPTNGVYASAPVAAAILSRVHLQMGNYDLAREAADRVISSGNYTLTTNYADAFNRTSNSTEDVFSIQVSEQDGANSMNLFYASSANGGRGDILVRPPHISLYEAGDDRLNLFYDSDTRTGKWSNQFGNIGVVRLAEMYLTRAEGNFREGAPYVGAAPMADLNEVRGRVNLPLYTLPTEFDLDDILLERKLELMFEGQLLHDLKRTQQDVGDISYDSGQITYPIPQREIDVNTSLDQNDYYEQ
ncbi:RagB/SusD family nutrient uptake outer membrane protein [Gracilimonas sp.]|uniref:RagB/SusD family nutrient uptake outer membrane protein n=1 Tax=Gracilimonas sp. TaxID=1974203 RepID=UPI0032EC1076